LTTTGGRTAGNGRSGLTWAVLGWRHVDPAKELCREKLVVRREQRRGVVQDDHATSLERPEHPHPVVDPVERRQHVQTPERDVSGSKHVERFLGRHPLPAHSVGDRAGDRLVRRRAPASDEREAHESTNRTDRRPRQARSPSRYPQVTGLFQPEARQQPRDV